MTDTTDTTVEDESLVQGLAKDLLVATAQTAVAYVGAVGVFLTIGYVATKRQERQAKKLAKKMAETASTTA